MDAQLRKLIDDAVKNYSEKSGAVVPENFDYDLDVSRDLNHGDYATNVAFKLAKAVRSKPISVANELKAILNTATGRLKEGLIDNVEVAGPGFMNIYLKKASLASVLVAVFQQDAKYGQSDFGKGRKVILEYVSANPTGPLTIAHGRQAAVGDSLARILNATGHKVYREFYLNDAGRQMNLLGQSVWARYCESFQMEADFPEDGYKGEYIKDLAAGLAAKHRDSLLKKDSSEAVKLCLDFAKDAMMESIRRDLADFKAEFDNFYSEKTLYEKDQVEKALQFLQKENFLYEEDGALWFRSSTFGDDKDRVVKKTSGEYTYLAPDIAYHKTKYEREFDWMVNFWGPDHHGYISRLKAACKALGFKDQSISIRIVQLTTLFRRGQPVRMSTRAGEFVTLRELIEEVGTDVTRFFFIMRRIESPLDFDLDLAKQKSQENPVYYLQYAHARIASILEFSKKKITPNVNLELLSTGEEIELIKMISEFPKILIQASQMLEPYRLADYLRDLATSFHKFYTVCRVVGEEESLTNARLFLVSTVKIVLRNGLELLGISQPESM